jgi:hypothetical protein
MGLLQVLLKSLGVFTRGFLQLLGRKFVSTVLQA